MKRFGNLVVLPLPPARFFFSIHSYKINQIFWYMYGCIKFVEFHTIYEFTKFIRENVRVRGACVFCFSMGVSCAAKKKTHASVWEEKKTWAKYKIFVYELKSDRMRNEKWMNWKRLRKRPGATHVHIHTHACIPIVMKLKYYSLFGWQSLRWMSSRTTDFFCFSSL